MTEYRAALYSDQFSDPLNGTVKLLIWRTDPYAGRPISILSEDGKWVTYEEGTAVASSSGIKFPAGAVEALATAIQNFQGHSSHADTEARVLREWLAVEQGRVNEALKHPKGEA